MKSSSNCEKQQSYCVNINGVLIGPGHKPYIVAEMSGNHNGDINRAYRILDAARQAGADAVKIQTYRPDTITIDHDSPEFTVSGGLWDGRKLYELYEEAHTPWEWHERLFAYARNIGLTLFSSPFDSTAVDLLEELGAPAYKIASPELIDLPLIRRVAKTGKPIVISTGMGNEIEIAEAIDAARSAGAKEIVILHCTAAYPTPPNECNLLTIPEIAKKYDVIVGLSDHSMGHIVSTISIALGASFIEKHFTLDRLEGGVDSAFSMEPSEFKVLVESVGLAHAALGRPAFEPTVSEATVFKNRRSLYVVKSIAKGELITEKNIRSIRPGNGMKPKYYDVIIGKRASRDLVFGEPLNPSMVDGFNDVQL